MADLLRHIVRKLCAAFLKRGGKEMKEEKTMLRYYVYLMIPILIWASQPVIGKAALDFAGPVTVCFFRGLTALVVVLPLAMKNGFRFQMFFTKNALFYGTVPFLLNCVVVQISLNWCSANVASILQAFMPVCMLVGGVLFLQEKMTFFKGIGAVLATTGIAVTCIGGTLIDENTTFFGILLAGSASVSWTVYSVYIKKHDPDTHPTHIAAMTFGVGIVLVAPLSIGEIALVTGIPEFSWEMIPIFIYLGTFVLGIANTAWSAAVAKLDAALTGLLFNLSPVLGMIFAVMVGEVLSGVQILGAAVVIFGILVGFRDEWMVIRQRKKTRKESELSGEG